MNVIRGLDRIALVLAIIAILPAFLLGMELYRRTSQTLNPTYLELTNKGWTHSSDTDSIHPNVVRLENKGAFTSIKLTLDPPRWQCSVAGVVSSVGVFLITLFGIVGIRKVVAWIIEGFRDEKKGEPNKHTG